MNKYQKRQAKLKRIKKLIVLDVASISLVAMMLLTSLGIEKFNKNKDLDIESTQDSDTVKEQVIEGLPSAGLVQEVRTLDELRQVKMDIYTNTFKDSDSVRREYLCVKEEDVLNLSREFSIAIEEYFKACGASNWTNEDLEQFWPNDIEYMVTAIAYRESSYRTNVTNDLGCSGLTCLNKTSLLKSLGDEWLVSRIWGNSVPQVNCNASEVDIFNPTTNIEYTYYNIGYNLANRFKKDKYFTDTDGERRCIWNVLDYSEEMQNRLIIASHLYGLTNVTDAIFGRKIDSETGKVIPIEDYIYSGYVEDVLDKMNELKNTYEQSMGY